MKRVHTTLRAGFSFLRTLRPLAAACLFGLVTLPALAQGAKPAAPPTPEAVVRALYQHYLDTQPDTLVAFNYVDPGVAKDYFEPTLAKLLVTDGGLEEPRLEFDPFVDGQEFEISSVDYVAKPISAKEAQVTAQFNNFDERKTIIYKLLRTQVGWRISDVSWGGGRETLRKLLSGPSR